MTLLKPHKLLLLLLSCSFSQPLLADVNKPIPETVLPAVKPLPLQQPTRQIQGFSFTGNTVISQADLQTVVKPFINRPINLQTLEQARQTLTKYYISQGYVNSGAILPSQKVSNGIVQFQLLEGTLQRIELTGNDQLRDDYLATRINPDNTQPLNLNQLKTQLERLRQKPTIDTINAELKPGTRPGEAWLQTTVVEKPALTLYTTLNNYRSPSVGASRWDIGLNHLSLTGNGDQLKLNYSLLAGKFASSEIGKRNNFSASYALPLSARDITLKLQYGQSDSLVIEEPFDTLNITGLSKNYLLGINVPLLQATQETFSLGLDLEHRRNQTFSNGINSNFTSGSRDGITAVTALRFSQNYSNRSRKYAIALRSNFSLGLSILGATDNPDNRSDLPDNDYFHWRGQASWAYRLGQTPHQVIARLNTQLSSSPLFTLEQLNIGGHSSVRGYRENQFLRDNAIIASLGLRLPIPWLTRDNGTPIFTALPFFDAGYGRNKGTKRSTDISSVGLGLLATPTDWLNARIDYGYALRNIDEGTETDLQDNGLHFNVNLKWAF